MSHDSLLGRGPGYRDFDDPPGAYPDDEGGGPRVRNSFTMIVSLLALAIGAVGLYLSIVYGPAGQPNGNAAPPGAQAMGTGEGDPDGLPARYARMDARIEAIERRQVELDKRLEQLFADSREAFQTVAGDVRALREDVGALARAAGQSDSMSEPPDPTREIFPTRQATRPAQAEAARQLGVEVPGSDGMRLHTVQQGETLSGIASRYGVPLAKVQRANPGVEPRRIRPGDEIYIPED